MSDWRPTISLKNLQTRADSLAQVRKFFTLHNVLEVETPQACLHTVTEPYIKSFELQGQTSKRYLQTSPEYAMKRLLAAGIPDIYQICKCFRQGEQGVMHNPEFTMIEWYRLNFSLQQMMQETVALIQSVLINVKQVEYITYDDVYKKTLGKSFFALSVDEINRICVENGLHSVQPATSFYSIQQQIDFIFSRLVAAQLDSDVITCIYHYPAAQAALAKLHEQDSSVAERFEIFCGGLELANGYVELTDAQLQLTRFQQDQLIRKENNSSTIAIDQRLLDAQQYGLPDCAGVAVGFDRLLMLALGANNIEEVISFSWNNA